MARICGAEYWRRVKITKIEIEMDMAREMEMGGRERKRERERERFESLEGSHQVSG